VKCGAPQGSVLGPILFAMYVNDLPQVVESLIALFAYDTKLYCSILFAMYVNNLPQVVESLIALFAYDTKLYCSITSDLFRYKKTLVTFGMVPILVTEYE